MSATELSKLRLAELTTNINRLIARKDDLEIEDAETNKVTIGKIEKKIAEYQAAIDLKSE